MQDCGVCSELFSVQIGHILIFSPKSQTQILNYQILNICRVLYSTSSSTMANRDIP